MVVALQIRRSGRGGGFEGIGDGPDGLLLNETLRVFRAIGMALALATGPLLVAGLLYAGIRRRDPTLLVPAALVAVVVSSVVTISIT